MVVDAAQGIEAQTLANVYLALDHDLGRCFRSLTRSSPKCRSGARYPNEIEDVIGLEAHDAKTAKTGLNVEEVLEQIVTKIPGTAWQCQMLL